jgi:hypothetical protein
VQVVVKEKKEIHLMDGPRYAGAIVELPEKVALRYLEAGAVERYETKVIREVPFPAAGAEEPSSASPAGQALPETTAKPSESGGKKRGRPRKQSSQ